MIFLLSSLWCLGQSVVQSCLLIKLEKSAKCKYMLHIKIHIYYKCKAIKKFSPLILSALYSINFQEKFDFWEEKKLRLNLLNLNFLSTVHSALDFKPLPRFHSSLTRISIVLPSIHEKTNRFETAMPLPHSSEILCLCLMKYFRICYTFGILKTI